MEGYVEFVSVKFQGVWMGGDRGIEGDRGVFVFVEFVSFKFQVELSLLSLFRSSVEFVEC